MDASAGVGPRHRIQLTVLLRFVRIPSIVPLRPPCQIPCVTVARGRLRLTSLNRFSTLPTVIFSPFPLEIPRALRRSYGRVQAIYSSNPLERQMDIVTKGRLDAANYAVTQELRKLGLYDAPMQEVDTYLVAFGRAYGWQWYRGSGHIDIPAVSLARLRDLWRGRYTSLRNILRHEFAHALADTHRGLFRSRRFSDAFGASHDSEVALEYDADFHLNSYAATSPKEDFAELFEVYVRYQGRLPSDLATKPRRRKWQFIDDLRAAISKGKRRW